MGDPQVITAEPLPRRAALLGAAAALSGLTLPARASAATAEITPAADFESYNNYAEFSPDKAAVRHLATALRTQDWTLRIEGEVNRPMQLAIEALGRFGLQERVYALRCVEGWSMLVPWQGIELGALLKAAEPTSRARFVEFISLHRPEEMLGQRSRISGLSWPYREGLRIDEAMHPLTLLATGAHGRPLARQNGAPVRLVVPWKYGFKSAKAITTIRLRESMPETSWRLLSPSEYGFYGNVNPQQPHPRWSQARELRAGETRKRPTLPFNGYAEQVAQLYADIPAHLQY